MSLLHRALHNALENVPPCVCSRLHAACVRVSVSAFLAETSGINDNINNKRIVGIMIRIAVDDDEGESRGMGLG